MKKTVTLVLAATCLTAALSGCGNGGPAKTPGADATSLVDATQNKNPAVSTFADGQLSFPYTDGMKMPYGVDLSPEDGSDSVERLGDHVESPYFRHPDVYNMTSTETLTILPQFQTIQQTSEWSCGVDCALMALNWYGKQGDWNVETLAQLRHTLDGDMADYPGTTLAQMLDIFEEVGGFTWDSTLDHENIYETFTLDTIRQYLAQGIPVLVCWNDWGGHWQVIIGYDTMGTETEQDDVILVADPYDTTDHNQDGYGIYPAERFYYNFSMYGAFPEAEGGNDMLFVAPSPSTDS